MRKNKKLKDLQRELDILTVVVFQDKCSHGESITVKIEGDNFGAVCDVCGKELKYTSFSEVLEKVKEVEQNKNKENKER